MMDVLEKRDLDGRFLAFTVSGNTLEIIREPCGRAWTIKCGRWIVAEFDGVGSAVINGPPRDVECSYMLTADHDDEVPR